MLNTGVKMAPTGAAPRTRATYVTAAVVVIAIVLLAAFAAGVFNPAARSSQTTTSSNSGGSTSFTGSSSSSESSSTTLSTSTGTNSVSFAGDWLTYHKNNARTGYDDSISTINPPSVSWKLKVDAAVFAEPLFFNGAVYVATENNTVYAISAASGTVEWSSHLGPAVNVTVPPYLCNGNTPDILPTVGITGTPAIDPTTNTIYVVPFINGSGYHLFAIDASTGQARWNVTIAPSGFNTTWEEERGALAIANGMVYVPFGGFSFVCGLLPPNGWLMAFSLDHNGTQYSYEVPSQTEGDIWSAEGVSVDSSGFVYVVTGDSTGSNPNAFDTAVIKLTPQLDFTDYFAPANWAYLDANDLDLGSTGATLIPGNFVFAIGKDGVGYLLNSSNLGKVGGQLFNATVCGPAGLNATGAWGSTSFAQSSQYPQGVIYVPCGTGGLLALALHTGASPGFSTLWNYSENFAGPAIITPGAVWNLDVYSGTLFALNPATGSLLYQISLFTLPYPRYLIAHFSTPSVGDGLVLFAGNATVYAINP